MRWLSGLNTALLTLLSCGSPIGSPVGDCPHIPFYEQFKPRPNVRLESAFGWIVYVVLPSSAGLFCARYSAGDGSPSETEAASAEA